MPTWERWCCSCALLLASGEVKTSAAPGSLCARQAVKEWRGIVVPACPAYLDGICAPRVRRQQLPLCTRQLSAIQQLPSCPACHAPHRFPSFLQGAEETLFVDPAVYSRNRAFRLYLSSKAGKQVGTFDCPPRAEKGCFQG